MGTNHFTPIGIEVFASRPLAIDALFAVGVKHMIAAGCMQWHYFIRNLIRSYTPVLLVLLVGVTLTILGSASLRQQYRAADQVRFDRTVWQTIKTIQERIRHYGLAVVSLEDFFAARESISQPEWRFRIQALSPDQNYPGLLEAGFAAIELSQSNTPPGATESSSGLSGPPSAISFRVLHAWARPPSAMGGVDPQFLADPAQAASAWQAVTTSSATLSGMRQLSAEIEGAPTQGFSIFAPVFRQPAQPSTVRTNLAEGEENGTHTRKPKGVVFCAVEPNLLLTALFGLAPREVGFELFSGAAPSDLGWLNRSGRKPPSLDPAFRAYIRTNLSFQVINQTWSIHCYTTPLFEREAALSRMWMVRPLGLALTLALSGLLAIQIRARIGQSAAAEELRSACDELQKAQNERERVSRDLHDGAIQSLYLHQLTLGRCERLLRSQVTQPTAAILAQARSGIDDLISELRRFLLREDVKPAEVMGYQEARNVLQALVRRLGKTESVRVQLSTKASGEVSLTAAQFGHLKRIAQEAISNSLRHARARTVRVDFSVCDAVVRLSIVDDGRGFEPHGAAASGNGLANMQARAAHLGGTLEMKSSAGQGTSVTLMFPLPSTSDLHHEQSNPD